MCHNTSTGRVFFVGAGPGAGDLITVRGARLIGEADLVVWPSGAVAAEMVREYAKADAELVDSARLGDEQLVRLYREAAARRCSVVRLVPGDVAVWAGLRVELDACRRLGLRVELVAGVSPLSAVVAATGRELAEPAILLTQFDAAHPEELPGTGTLAVTASASRTEALVARLRAGGRPDSTPVVVAVKPTRPDEVVVSTTLGELDRAVKRHRLWLPAIFLVGRSDPATPARVGAARYASDAPDAPGPSGSATTPTPVTVTSSSSAWSGPSATVGSSARSVTPGASGSSAWSGPSATPGLSGSSAWSGSSGPAVTPASSGLPGPSGAGSVAGRSAGGAGGGGQAEGYGVAARRDGASALHRPYRRRRRPSQGGAS